VNVKDVPSKEFIDAFAKHLKKGNKIKIPEVRSRMPNFIMAAIAFIITSW
jgi:ribosomal protein S19E (S16A)